MSTLAKLSGAIVARYLAALLEQRALLAALAASPPPPPPPPSSLDPFASFPPPPTPNPHPPISIIGMHYASNKLELIGANHWALARHN